MSNTETPTFTPEEVSAYLNDPIVTDDHDLGSIVTCVNIVSRFPLGSEDRNPELIRAAMASICDWAGDYGVDIGFEVEENEV